MKVLDEENIPTSFFTVTSRVRRASSVSDTEYSNLAREKKWGEAVKYAEHKLERFP